MYHALTDGGGGWPWPWMVPMMLLLWVAVLGSIYGTVRLAVQRARRPEPPARR
jgi:hypothetical protein